MSEPDVGSRAGSRFGPFQLSRLLGHDEVSEVYAAEDTRDDRAVAVRLIAAKFCGDAEVRARLQEAVRSVQRLTEAHIVGVDGYDDVDGVLCLRMPLIDGDDLAALLKRCGPLSAPRAVAIVHQIADALDAAHAEDIVHGAVTSANVLVTGDDIAYLTDFGIARAVGVGSGPGEAGAVTAAADVQGLAGVLAECLTRPHPGAAAQAEPAPGQAPAALGEVVNRGLSIGEHYGSAGALAGAACAALSQPERNQVARILRRGAPAGIGMPASARPWWAVRPAGRVAHQLRPAPTLPSQLVRTRWYTPALGRLRQRRRPMVIGAAAVAVILAAAGAGYSVTRPSQSSSAAAPRQAVLPFTDPDYRLSPGGVALDADGDVYVTSQGVSGRLVKLPVGSAEAAVVPAGDLYQPQGVAVDGRDNVYISDFNNRVVKLDAGSGAPSVLPFTGLDKPAGLAVDAAGNVYVADRGNNQVVKLEAGSNVQSVVPFTGLRRPGGVAVDAAGAVYVTDTDNNRVVKSAGGTGEPVVLAFTGIAMPWGVTVDGTGTVYVTEYRNNKVAKLTPGAAVPVVVPFTGLNTPSDVAVDGAGNVYVADRGNDRVVKLPA